MDTFGEIQRQIDRERERKREKEKISGYKDVYLVIKNAHQKRSIINILD